MSPPKRKNKISEYEIGQELISKYMKQRDIPDWFRGISRFQVLAAERLFEALLYDGEQHSTHRVRECMTSLGLRPMVPSDQLKKLILLSRGNDLAYLWFLLESNYKTNGPGYSINEQIIYSAIAHLDMVTTLRELDRLLPHNPPRQEKTDKKHKQVVVRPDVFKHFKIPKNAKSPYLEPIKTPNLYHEPIELKRPDPKLFLGDYEVYKDPRFTVRNESNRWFATYKTKTSRRVASVILREEIDNLFDNIESFDDKIIACAYHYRLLEAERKSKQNAERKRREKIQNYFDVDGMDEERTRKRIVEQIEKDVKMLMQKSRYDVERTKLISSSKSKSNDKQKIEVFEGEDSIRYCIAKRAKWMNDECVEKQIEEWDDDEEDNKSDDDEDKEDEKKSDEHFSSGPPMSMTALCGTINKSNRFMEPFCGESHSIPPDNEDDRPHPYFKGSQMHRPWYFDYQNIFNIDNPKKTDVQRMKLAFVKALNNKPSVIPEITGTIDIDKAFNTGFEKQWQQSVEEYNHAMDLLPKIDEYDIAPLSFDRDYFDPSDKKYMIHMLKRCFDHMRRNPRFVLASLPDAHKMPAFFFFIQDRYGKRYSFRERARLYTESLQILRALEKLTKVVPVPKLNEFSTNPYVSYACRNYLLAKSKAVRQKYYDEIDKIIMQQSRIFWFAIRPHLRLSGPPRHSYFAYMPPTTVDITRFRQWRSNEFMDAKQAWVRRQRQKRGY